MHNTHDEYARRLNFQFKRLQYHYKNVVKYNAGTQGVIVDPGVLYTWLTDENSGSPVIKLFTMYSAWSNSNNFGVDTGFEREIEYHLREGNKNYFNMLDNMFHKTWEFIQTDLKDALYNYVRDARSSVPVWDKLYNPPQKFTKAEFLDAIAMHTIFIFDLFEKLYKKLNYNYSRLFIESEVAERPVLNPNFLPLNYGSLNNNITELLYKEITAAGFIDCTLQEFQNHFDPYVLPPRDKITWLKSNTTLSIIFRGSTFTDADTNLRHKINLQFQKHISAHDIGTHFRQPYQDFTLGNLKAGYSGISQTKRPKDYKFIIHLFQQIGKLTLTH
ncbi:hypothetical protein GCM10027037_12460 [Mucilaginibacter koreensis]